MFDEEDWSSECPNTWSTKDNKLSSVQKKLEKLASTEKHKVAFKNKKKLLKLASPEKHINAFKKEKKRKPNKRNKYRNNSEILNSSTLPGKSQSDCTDSVTKQKNIFPSEQDSNNAIHSKDVKVKKRRENSEDIKNHISSPENVKRRKKNAKRKSEVSLQNATLEFHPDNSNSANVNPTHLMRTGSNKSEPLSHVQPLLSKKKKKNETILLKREKLSSTNNGEAGQVKNLKSDDSNEKPRKKRRRKKKLAQLENSQNGGQNDAEVQSKFSDQESEPEISLLFEKNHVPEDSDRSNNLRTKMLAQLAGGQFRFLNEQLYSIHGEEAYTMFSKDSDSFKLYHEGYRNQVLKWPVNPIDVIIAEVQAMPLKLVIADFGCGDAKLAQTFPKRTIHSFDLVALNSYVTACNMSKVPLKASSVDVSIFCLSLMGSNLGDYILEANRVLKNGGKLKIAELESRFDDVQLFVNDLKPYGFQLTKQTELNDYFLMFELKKKANVRNLKQALPEINLKPCLYKRR